MGKSNSKCFYCHLPAVKLCDHVLGWAFGAEVTDIRGGQRRIASSDYHHTCDMPLCARHAETRGHVHIKMGRGGVFDTYDYCPEHPIGPHEKKRVLQDDEAATLREAVRVLARRRLGLDRVAVSPPSPEQGTLF